jgi:hypothetical protein
MAVEASKNQIGNQTDPVPEPPTITCREGQMNVNMCGDPTCLHDDMLGLKQGGGYLGSVGGLI